MKYGGRFTNCSKTPKVPLQHSFASPIKYAYIYTCRRWLSTSGRLYLTSPKTSLSNSFLLSFNIFPPVDSSSLEHVGGRYVRHKSSTRLFGRYPTSMKPYIHTHSLHSIAHWLWSSDKDSIMSFFSLPPNVTRDISFSSRSSHRITKCVHWPLVLPKGHHPGLH